MRHTHTATVYDTGHVNIPAEVIESQEISYHDEVRVILPSLGGDDTIVGFTRYADSTLKLTIPAAIRNRFDLSGDTVEVEMTATGDRWEPDDPTQTRGGNRTDVRALR